MTKRDLSDVSVEQLVAEFARAAALHGRATEEGDWRAGNRQHALLSAAYRELRARGEREALLPLLADGDIAVRCTAAARALEFAPQAGEAVLTATSQIAGVHGLNATMILKVWRNGELSFS